jgi:lipoate-protein ligase A
VKDSFRILTGFLIDFYRRLGLDASYAVDASEYTGQLGTRTSFCFAGRETYDILVNGRKIGGNAQRRLKNIIFQHGSIPIISDVDIGLSYMDGCTPDEDLKVTSLEGCGVRESVERLTGILVESFRSCFSVHLINDILTPVENGLAEQLSESKYMNDRWNIEGLE